MTSERLEIPHPDIGGTLVGILERRGPPTPVGQPRPLALVRQALATRLRQRLKEAV
jgi:hypothetical protein